MSFEDPWQFNLKKRVKNRNLLYLNITELSQGGPEIGYLYIDGNIISENKFGGPIISDNNFIYAPMYVKTFWKSGFKLVKINLTDLKITIIGKTQDLIHLYIKEGNKIRFYKNKNKSLEGSLELLPN